MAIVCGNVLLWIGLYFLGPIPSVLLGNALFISLNKCSARQRIISCIANKLPDSVSNFLSKIQEQQHVPEEVINMVGENK